MAVVIFIFLAIVASLVVPQKHRCYKVDPGMVSYRTSEEDRMLVFRRQSERLTIFAMEDARKKDDEFADRCHANSDPIFTFTNHHKEYEI